MQMSKGVEWATHACAALAAVPADKWLSAIKLAEYLGVPRPYLVKQMQALSRAGLVETSRGAGGGYRLARQPDAISLDDIVNAIEGRGPAFRCSEVRQRGPIPSSRESCRKPCGIAASFWKAESAWHAALAQTTLGSLLARHAAGDDKVRARRAMVWVIKNVG